MAFCAVGILSFTAFSQEFDPKQRAKQSLALRAAAQDVVLLLSQQSEWHPEESFELSAELSKAILNDVKGYQQKAAGEAVASAWLTEWRKQNFNANMQAAIQSAQSQSPLPLDAEVIQKRAAADWENQRDRGAEKFSATAVKQVYPQARERTVSELKKQLEAGLHYPSQAEVDQWLLGLNAKAEGPTAPLTESEFQSLKDSIKSQVVPFEFLLEEVSQEPARLSEKVLKNLWLQYQGQIDLVTGALKQNLGEKDLWVADDMMRAIQAGLKAAPAAKPEARPPVYGVFEVVSLWGDAAAVDWEKAQLVNFLQVWEEGAVTPVMLERMMKVKLSAHLRPEASAEALKMAVVEVMVEQLVDAWMVNAPAPRQAALRDYYLESLQGEGHLASTWEAEIDKKLNQLLPAIRQAIAVEQLQVFYPGLLTEEGLPESVVLWFYDRELAEARESKQIAQAFEMEDDPTSRIFTETQTLAVEELNEDLQPALKSLEAQIQLIREMEKEGMDALKASVANGQDANALYDQWRKAWEQRWQGIREAQDPRWQEMTGRTADELRKTVRQWYESVKENLAEIEESLTQNPTEEQIAELEPPNSPEMTPVEVPLEPVSEPQGVEEEEPVSDMGDAEAEPKPDAGITEELENFRGKADGVLAFSDLANGDCRLLFGSPDGKGALSVGFDPENVDASAQKIAEALSGPLRDVLNGTASANEKGGFRLFTRAKEPTLSMLFQVDSPKIRHQMSIQVRQLIQQEIDTWAEEKGQKAPVLLWQDEMGLLP